ncbi:MAG: exodeoxyribonuclease VII large subunit [Polyangiales bacterium]
MEDDSSSGSGVETAAPRAATVPYVPLSRVMNRLREVMTPALGKPFWVRAELGSMTQRDGTVYGELVETERKRLVAKVRCAIWAQDLVRIRERFASAGLELDLQQGTAIVAQCDVQFHVVHGLSMRVRDIDPSFVLGELELRRRRALQNLERAGLLRTNGELPLALLPNRIVLITSGSSAAFHDFTRTLTTRRVAIRVWLADTVMQGPDTERSVLRALDAAERLPADLVVLVRGGGSKIDLGWLDSEPIARRIATLKKPVWTGIGHETDTSLLDAVSARAFRTPTAAAEALCERFESVMTRLHEAERRMRMAFNAALRTQRDHVDRHATGLPRASRRLLALRRVELDGRGTQLSMRLTNRTSHLRAAWLERWNHLQQSTRVRLLSADHRMAQLREKLPSSGRSVLVRQRGALEDASQRLTERRWTARLQSAQQQLALQRLALERGGLQGLASLRAQLQADSAILRSRVSGRLSAAELLLAPRTQALRGTLALSARAATTQLAALREQLTSASRRELQRARQALLPAYERVSMVKLAPRLAREHEALAQREQVLRASDPRLTLARGFSLTYTASGVLVKSHGAVGAGARITTHLADGTVDSVVEATRQAQEDTSDDGQD